MRSKLLTAALIVMGAVSAAFAQATGAPPPPSAAPAVPPPAASGGLAACRADMATLCRGVSGGRQARVACLVANRAKVSPECATVLAAIEGQGLSVGRVTPRPARACRADIQSLCGTVARGAERQQCLKQNEAKLSAECRDSLSAAATLRRDVRSACRADRLTLCSGETAGQGTIRGTRLGCLRANTGKLSPACAAALAQLPPARLPRRPGAADPTPAQPAPPR